MITKKMLTRIIVLCSFIPIAPIFGAQFMDFDFADPGRDFAFINSPFGIYDGSSMLPQEFLTLPQDASPTISLPVDDSMVFQTAPAHDFPPLIVQGPPANASSNNAPPVNSNPPVDQQISSPAQAIAPQAAANANAANAPAVQRGKKRKTDATVAAAQEIFDRTAKRSRKGSEESVKALIEKAKQENASYSYSECSICGCTGSEQEVAECGRKHKQNAQRFDFYIPSNKLACGLCAATSFTDRTAWLDHRNNHIGAYPYQCLLCAKRFATNRDTCSTCGGGIKKLSLMTDPKDKKR